MSIEVQDKSTLPCTVCGAEVNELRRGRCWGCYTQWLELRPVGRGASCGVCGERRRDNLRMTELHGRSQAMCHICASRMVRMTAVPETVDGLRVLLHRERRQDPRRGDKLDHRIFPRERRVGDRRHTACGARRNDTNPMIMIPDFDDIVIELDDGDLEVVEQTLVREAPRPPVR